MSKKLLCLVAAFAGALFPASLFAQQTGPMSVLIDGVVYVAENSQSTATVIVPVGAVVGGYYGRAPDRAPRENGRKGHFGFGPGVYIFTPDHADEGNTHYGMSLGGGFAVAQSDVGRVRFHFDAGAYYWSKKNNNAVALPLTCTLGYEFNIGTPHFRIRVGALLGETTFISHIPGAGNAVGAGFSYGGETGLAWTSGDKFYLDLGYRYIGNSKVKLDYGDNFTTEMKGTAMQVNFSIGWRL